MASKPRVILGTMTFGPPGTESKGARITSLDEYNDCLSTLSSNGYLELDTARVYIDGQQEAFTRSAEYAKKGFSIATKCYPHTPGLHSSERLKATLNKSLEQLDTKCVDIFYLHAPDRSVPFEETLQACDELFKEAWEVAEICQMCKERKWVQPRIYQAMYNCITRAMETELVPCCRKFGLDIVIYNPLAGGLFSGKYSSLNTPSEGRFSATNSNQGKLYRDRYFRPAFIKALEMVEPVAKKHNTTLIEVALRWVVHHSKLNMDRSSGSNDGIIIGVSSKKQLESNIEALEKGPLPDELVKVLDDAWEVVGGSCPSYWR
ncbi:hypothetical protein LTR51_001871 [Lithohypha guttulata]|nr:hypothetical protein LTR51_001871 [Lithohypha guttulata]